MIVDKKEIKVHVNVCTVGHVDHGKTTLTAAITLCASKEGRGKQKSYEDIDKAPEEKARGITINAATVKYETVKREVSHTDCPGHEDYVKNMIAGASQVDIAIVVISACDGPKPQTYEHIALLKQLGIKNIIVYLNKMDRINPNNPEEAENPDIAELEAREIFTKQGYDDDKIIFIRGSATEALAGVKSDFGVKSIYQIFEAIDSFPDPIRDIDKPFLMFVEHVNGIPGRGTVISGKIERGTIRASVSGETFDILGKNMDRKGVSVSSIETFNTAVPTAHAGHNVGLLLRGVARDEVVRGQAICQSGSVQPQNRFIASIYINEKRTAPIFNGYKPQLFYKTVDVSIESLIIMDPGKKMIMPGEYCEVEIVLSKPVVLFEKGQFSLREARDVGAGVITKILPFCHDPENYKKDIIKISREGKDKLVGPED